jgi:hypothetical protein
VRVFALRLILPAHFLTTASIVVIAAGLGGLADPEEAGGAVGRPRCRRQLSGKTDWAQAGRADGWIDVTHLTHQKPRRPGATIRAG